MKLEGGQISSSQLTILAIGFMIGTSIIFSPGTAAKSNAWLAIITGLLEALVFVWIYTSLIKQYPDKTLVEVNDIIYGPYLGKIFSIFYLLFFLHIASLVVRTFGEFYALFMPNTPLPVFLIFILMICALAVRNGIEVIARCSLILVPLMFLTIIIATLLIAKDIELSNLLPIMDIPISEFFQASHSVTTVTFGETIVFFMVATFLNKKQEARSSIVKALLIVGLFFIVIAISNTAVLGPFAPITTYPSFTLFRLIDIADVLTRLDIIISINFLTMGFLKVTVLYYGLVLGTAQMFKIRSYLPLVLPIGALTIGLSLMQYDNYIDDLNDAFKFFPYYSLPFEFFLPLITLIVAKAKRSIQ